MFAALSKELRDYYNSCKLFKHNNFPSRRRRIQYLIDVSVPLCYFRILRRVLVKLEEAVIRIIFTKYQLIFAYGEERTGKLKNKSHLFI